MEVGLVAGEEPAHGHRIRADQDARVGFIPFPCFATSRPQTYINPGVWWEAAYADTYG